MGFTHRIKVIANRPKTEWANVLADGTQKIRVAAPAEKGKANEALRRFLSKEWNVPLKNIEIIRGVRDSLKLIRIKDENES